MQTLKKFPKKKNLKSRKMTYRHRYFYCLRRGKNLPFDEAKEKERHRRVAVNIWNNTTKMFCFCIWFWTKISVRRMWSKKGQAKLWAVNIFRSLTEIFCLKKWMKSCRFLWRKIIIRKSLWHFMIWIRIWHSKRINHVFTSYSILSKFYLYFFSSFFY